MKSKLALSAALALALVSCGKGEPATDSARVDVAMKAWLGSELRAFHDAAADLQRAAPTPMGRGWSASEDAAAIRRMKAAWGRARLAYESIEGALAPLFPDSDTATDARYDDFLGKLGAAGDPDAFDARGVIGMHALERVLWADSVPRETVAFESRLPGYRAAAFPASEAEARSFKEQLAAKLVTDIEQLEGQLEPLELDVAFVFRGLLDLTNEQLEKVDRAATGREESRYSESTLFDLRANRAGCLIAYRLFQPGLLARGHGDLDRRVMAGFARLAQAYDATPGAAIPRPPADWSSLDPSPEHASTAFGKLFSVVRRETDRELEGSLSQQLMRVADALGLPPAFLK